MSTHDVAHSLVTLCREGRFLDALEQLYSPDIVSVEPADLPGLPAELRGIEAVRGKNQWWIENNEVHSVEVEGPYIGDDRFAVRFTMDTTLKPTGERSTGTEMALYTVRDGKVVREEFYYNAPASGG